MRFRNRKRQRKRFIERYSPESMRVRIRRRLPPVDWQRELEVHARAVAHAMQAIHGVAHNVIVNHDARMVMIVQAWNRQVHPR